MYTRIILFVVLPFVSGLVLTSHFTWAGLAEKNTTFVVLVNTAMFSETAALHVRLYDTRQAELNKRMSRCAVSYDMQTKTERMRCPEGMAYQKPAPEEWSIPVEDITAQIEIQSVTVEIGEEYSLSISGLSRDGCNTASAHVTGIADSAQVVLENLNWMTTEMACR